MNIIDATCKTCGINYRVPTGTLICPKGHIQKPRFLTEADLAGEPKKAA